LIRPQRVSYYNEYVAGVDYQLPQNSPWGLLRPPGHGRVLEMCSLSDCRDRSWRSRRATADYTLTNPAGTPVLGGLGASFEAPVHDYTRSRSRESDSDGGRFTPRIVSRLTGTFEGFYRRRQRSSDPGITSFITISDERLSYVAIGVPGLRLQGDIRFQGEAGPGPCARSAALRPRCTDRTSWISG